MTVKVTRKGPLLTGKLKADPTGGGGGGSIPAGGAGSGAGGPAGLAMALAIGHILRRTSASQDTSGGAFVDYSDDYAEHKARSKRDSGIVDLNWTGHLMNAIKGRFVSMRDATIVTIDIAPVGGVKSKTPRNLVGLYLQRRRKWFGFTAAFKRELMKVLQKNIGAIFGGPMVTKIPTVRRPPIRE